MKGKSITFRPKKEMRERLEKLAELTERPVTFFIDKAIEAHLPELEKRYGTQNFPAHPGRAELNERGETPNASTREEGAKTATEFLRKHDLPAVEAAKTRARQKSKT